MTDAEGKPTMLGYDLQLASLWRRIYARIRLVIGVVLLTLALTTLYLHFATYNYTATLLVSPVMSSSSSGNGGGLSSKLSNLGGLSSLASMAGISLNNDAGAQSFMMYQEGIYSRDVADQLAQDPKIMHAVFATKWDEASGRWRQPSPFIHAIAGFFQDLLGLPPHGWEPPDGALLQEYIVNNIGIDTDPDKPIVTITLRDPDPQLAVSFLGSLDRAVDNKLRNIALVRANEYIGYLSVQLDKITNTDIRQALMATLTDQENTKMMASVTAPYAAQPFGPPSASRRPTNPKPFLVLAGALFGGILLGSLAALWLPPFFGRRVRKKPSTAD